MVTKNYSKLFVILSAFLLMFVAMPLVSANSAIKILNPVDQAGYTTQLNSFEFQYLSTTSTNQASCWYVLNGGQQTTIPCQLGNNLVNGIQTIEGINTLSVYLMDSTGEISMDEVEFQIYLGNNGTTVIIIDPIDGEIYNKHLISFEFQYLDVSEYPISCWYVLNGLQETIFPCQLGNNLVNGIQTIEGTNTLEVYVKRMDSQTTASDKATFFIDLDDEKCNHGSTFKMDDNDLDQFYLNQSLQNDLKRRAIHLDESLELSNKLTCWQKFVNWVGNIFGWAPAYK